MIRAVILNFDGFIFESNEEQFLPEALEFLKENYRKFSLFLTSSTIPFEQLMHIVNQKNIAVYFRGIFGTPKDKGYWGQKIRDEFGYTVEEIVWGGDAPSGFVSHKDLKSLKECLT